MAERIIINVLNKDEYLSHALEIGLDGGWKVKSEHFDNRMKSKGVYAFYVRNPLRTIYVGKTRGPTVDFATRLYRHATKSGSRDSKVYQALKQAERETGGPILVSLVTTNQLTDLFEGMHLQDTARIDIYEQVLIHFLKPEVQDGG